jgi:hypothetical protein
MTSLVQTWREEPGVRVPFLQTRADKRRRTDMRGRRVWTLWREANQYAWVFEERDGWTLCFDGVKRREAMGPFLSADSAKAAFSEVLKKFY